MPAAGVLWGSHVCMLTLMQALYICVFACCRPLAAFLYVWLSCSADVMQQGSRMYGFVLCRHHVGFADSSDVLSSSDLRFHDAAEEQSGQVSIASITKAHVACILVLLLAVFYVNQVFQV